MTDTDETEIDRQVDRQIISQFVSTLLTNLRGTYENADIQGQGVLGQYSAYKMLKEGTGQDFGYDVGQWEDWMYQDGNLYSFRITPPPKVEFWLYYLLPLDSMGLEEDGTGKPGYMTQEEARQHLTEDSGVDFGHDFKQWRELYLKNRPSELRQFPLGYQPPQA